VDLVRPRADRAIGPDQKGPVGKTPVGVIGLERERADDKPDPEPPGLGAKRGNRGVIAFVVQDSPLMAAAGRNAIRHLGGQDDLCPVRRRLRHPRAHSGEVFAGIIA